PAVGAVNVEPATSTPEEKRDAPIDPATLANAAKKTVAVMREDARQQHDRAAASAGAAGERTGTATGQAPSGQVPLMDMFIKPADQSSSPASHVNQGEKLGAPPTNQSAPVARVATSPAEQRGAPGSSSSPAGDAAG